MNRRPWVPYQVLSEAEPRSDALSCLPQMMQENCH